MSQAPRSRVVPLLALAAGPAAWVVQLIVGYGISSLACYPHDAPAARAPGAGEHGALIALNLACLLVAAIGFAVAGTEWRRSRAPKPGASNDVLPAAMGRARFLAACGMLSATGFAIAILFDTAPILGAPACWRLFG